LEQLYRPFLERGLPVNLAVIPNVRTDVTAPEGRPEGFLLCGNGGSGSALPIGSNQKLVRYLLENPGYSIAQHGYYHERFEFDVADRRQLQWRLEDGTRLLVEAGFPRPQTFVAPHDKLSRVGLTEVARRFRVLSTGWFEWRRLPLAWWPNYFLQKKRNSVHWRAGRTLLLGHPGCLLSCHRPYSAMLDEIKKTVASRRLTVLVTHWWEYFRAGAADGPFIDVLHQTAAYLSSQPDLAVVSFDDLAAGNPPLN